MVDNFWVDHKAAQPPLLASMADRDLKYFIMTTASLLQHLSISW
jgi:hypothetical protein